MLYLIQATVFQCILLRGVSFNQHGKHQGNRFFTSPFCFLLSTRTLNLPIFTKRNNIIYCWFSKINQRFIVHISVDLTFLLVKYFSMLFSFFFFEISSKRIFKIERWNVELAKDASASSLTEMRSRTTLTTTFAMSS